MQVGDFGLAVAIPPLDEAAMAAASERQRLLAKPPGSLGVLEEVSVRLAGMRGGWERPLGEAAVVVMAADHGVAAELVSAYPSAVTSLMVATFAAGGATVNAIARSVGARVVVVDMGVSEPVTSPGVVSMRIGPGTRNLAREPAMSRLQAVAALNVGLAIAQSLADDGVELVVAGEMGIANTTAASALVAALTGAAPADVTGRGTGIGDESLRHKVGVIERALARSPLDTGDGVGVLASVGGFEIGGLAGLCLGAASARIPVIIDGLISAAAALIAHAVAPGVRDYLIAGHRSTEPGHRVALRTLGLQPLLDLGMRLGEGSGAALAIPLVRAAVAVLRETATLDAVVHRAGDRSHQGREAP